MVDTGVLFTAGMGVVSWGAAAWQAVRQWKASSGRHVTGLVTEVRAAQRGSSSVVRFPDESGTPCRTEVNFRGTVGQEVRLGHPAGQPQRARRIGGVAPWGFPVMAVVVGGGFFWFAGAVLTGGLPRVLVGH